MLWTAFAAIAFGRVVDQKDPFTDAEYWTLWKHFQSFEDHTGYSTMSEHNERFEIFKKNMDYAREFNAKDEYSFKLGVTTFADQTQEEFTAYLAKSSRTKPKKPSARAVYDMTTAPEAPEAIDWSTQGAVTPIKNQGQCGSCWAFSTTGSIEGQNYIKNKKLSSFSEQELVDCSGAEGNQGCNGGLMDDGFDYVHEYGLCYESAYPYTGQDGTCQKSSCTEEVKVASHTDVAAGDTAALMSACATVGPISIAVDANMYWQLYSSGIFDHMCNKSKLDHGVLLVGYSSGSYWKVKNSWGATWGEEGYIRLKGTSENTCGLANSASYPTLE